MNRLRSRRGRRNTAFAAIALVVAMPVVAFFAAPGARADDTPGANLAGLNVSANATGMQFVPLVKGLVPAGNLATGDFFQISVPYSGATSDTGPACTATGTPVYPGPVATTLPGALQTEGFPAQLAGLTADPALANAAYPPEPGRGSSGSYSPPSGSTSGAGPAHAKAAVSGCQADAATNDTPLAGGQIQVGSSTTTASTTVKASSVASTARASVSRISILNGLVQIASVDSVSTATSDGTAGTQTSALKIGAVTVAKQPAYIGPDGLHLASSSNDLLGGIQAFNSVLTALNQAGISISTIEPTSSVQGAAASVDSGGIRIQFVDPNIPSPGGSVPVNSVGSDIDLGLSHADAQASLFPPLPPIVTSTTTSVAPVVSSQGPPSVASNPPSGGGQTIIQTTNPGSDGGNPPAPQLAGSPQGTGSPLVAEPASFIGMPTKLAWVVISILLSIIASGPLLGYANWQLLRGRKT
ncbi:MAG TPA: choice-of-anchor P family protein [Acidimicrobiales bacterium]|nr:choice-of-anchor P family protein [Acidimicrobiales bacterium]